MYVRGAVQYSGEDFGWYQIDFNQGIGYVAKDFLSEKASTDTAAKDLIYTGNVITIYVENDSPLTLYEATDGYWYDKFGTKYVEVGDGSYFNVYGSDQSYSIYNPANNSGYTGNFYLRGKNSSNMVYVKADHASSFAGNPETFAPKGLRMSNAKLTVVNGNTLPVNRGLYIGAASAIETTDAMTVNSAFAFESTTSTLTKSGSQTLKLAGGVQEGSAAGIFNITAGTLDIAGSDTVEADFRGSATLKASGSAVVKPLAASTFSGALTP